jgi:hypothetical protein
MSVTILPLLQVLARKHTITRPGNSIKIGRQACELIPTHLRTQDLMPTFTPTQDHPPAVSLPHAHQKA